MTTDNNTPHLPASEPVLTTAGITAAAAAVIALVTAFGVGFSDEQTVAILGVVAVAAPLIVSVSRRWVTPNVRVVEQELDGQVIAGEASELDTGTVVREAGGLHDGYTSPEGDAAQ